MSETTTVTLTGFLLARIGEDEVAARGAEHWDPAPWEAAGGYVYPADHDCERTHGKYMHYGHESYGGLWDDEGSETLAMQPATAAHVARHDPARILAECEAKRRIVEAYELSDPYDPDDGWVGLNLAVRSLAAVYADHRGYRDEWRP